MTVTITSLAPEDDSGIVRDLARLRISVFREYPYLYSGDEDYEREYLDALVRSSGAVVVVASDGGRVVGAATAGPLSEQHEEFRRPFEARGENSSEIFYFGESVLLPEYRGRGLGHAFFDEREAAARRAGARRTTFCAVVRPEDHPRRPEGYRPLDAFWRKRGYERLEGVTTKLDWQELDSEGEVSHRMQFWGRELTDE